MVIPASYNNLPVTTIADKAFDSIPITDVTIPSSITSIGKQSFYGNKLASITIPNSVTSIGEGAFRSNANITSVTIPNSVTQIGSFQECWGITSVTFQGTIPSSGFADKLAPNIRTPFDSDLRTKFYETDETNGTPGTYTRPNPDWTTPWTKQ